MYENTDAIAELAGGGGTIDEGRGLGCPILPGKIASEVGPSEAGAVAPALKTAYKGRPEAARPGRIELDTTKGAWTVFCGQGLASKDRADLESAGIKPAPHAFVEFQTGDPWA